MIFKYTGNLNTNPVNTAINRVSRVTKQVVKLIKSFSEKVRRADQVDPKQYPKEGFFHDKLGNTYVSEN